MAITTNLQSTRHGDSPNEIAKLQEIIDLESAKVEWVCGGRATDGLHYDKLRINGVVKWLVASETNLANAVGSLPAGWPVRDTPPVVEYMFSVDTWDEYQKHVMGDSTIRYYRATRDNEAYVTLSAGEIADLRYSLDDQAPLTAATDFFLPLMNADMIVAVQGTPGDIVTAEMVNAGDDARVLPTKTIPASGRIEWVLRDASQYQQLTLQTDGTGNVVIWNVSVGNVLSSSLTIMSGVTTAVTNGDSFALPRGVKAFQASVTGTGAVTATVEIERSADGTNWIPAPAAYIITLSDTTLAFDGISADDAWAYHRASVTAISGTGATVQVEAC